MTCSQLFRGIAVAIGWWSAAVVQAAQPLAVCDDAAGWPPYTYTDPAKPGVVTGAVTELVLGLLRRADYAPQLTLLPWKRCLAEVQSGKAALLLNATYSAERARLFLLSKPLYHINSALFYADARFAAPPVLGDRAAMKSYRYCGLLGYNYTMYDLAHEQIDTSARDETQRFDMLRSGRCDFVLGDLEILRAFDAMGQLNLKGLSHVSIPGDKPKAFHVMVSKAVPGAEQLLRIIDDGVAAAKADKSFDHLFKKFGL